MPEISPFRALRFNSERFGDQLGNLIAPPYDVLDEQDKTNLLRGHDRNIVAVDLPFVPPKSAGPDEVYVRAGRTLAAWRQDGTLVQEARPAVYIYHQEYTHHGKTYTRRMFLAAMRIEAFGQGTVFPHELTFGGPKEDRRKLMEATQCQLSPIFGLYSDPESQVSMAMNVNQKPPDVSAAMDGILNKLWVVSDPQTIKNLSQALAGRAVYIADGHHRYGTALAFRDALIAKQGELPPNHPARFVLTGFCAMEDPGCLILPTHRVISGFGEAKPAQILTALQQGVKTRTADPNITDPEKLLPADSPDEVGIYMAAGDRMYTGKFTHRHLLDQLAPRQSPAWRELDLAYLHRYLIDECVTQALGGAAPTIGYWKSAAKACDSARETNGIALLTRPCGMAQLRAVSEAGDLMPQKSTYFYPKLATGLVLYPLD